MSILGKLSKPTRHCLVRGKRSKQSADIQESVRTVLLNANGMLWSNLVSGQSTRPHKSR